MFCDVLQKMRSDACTGRTYGCCQILFAIFASKYKQISLDYFDTGTITFFVKKDHFSLFSSRYFCTFRHKSPYKKSPLKHGRQEMLNSVHHNKRLHTVTHQPLTPTLISDGLGLQKLSSTSILKCPPRVEGPSTVVMPVLGSMVQYSLLHMFIGEYPMMCCSREGGVGNIWIR